MDTKTLSEAEIEQYSRQLIVKNWGLEKQLKLMSIVVLIEETFIYSAFYLAAAGVKKITVLKKEKQDQNGLIKLLQTIHPGLELNYVNPKSEQKFNYSILGSNTSFAGEIAKEIRITKFQDQLLLKFESFKETFAVNNTGISFVDNLACSLIIQEIFRSS